MVSLAAIICASAAIGLLASRFQILDLGTHRHRRLALGLASLASTSFLEQFLRGRDRSVDFTQALVMTNAFLDNFVEGFVGLGVVQSVRLISDGAHCAIILLARRDQPCALFLEISDDRFGVGDARRLGFQWNLLLLFSHGCVSFPFPGDTRGGSPFDQHKLPAADDQQRPQLFFWRRARGRGVGNARNAP
jgi:hypothetical protein